MFVIKRNNVPKPYYGKYPGHIIQMELMENLPISNCYKSILIKLDTFSKWAKAIALPSTKVEEISNAFINTWWLIFRHAI